MNPVMFCRKISGISTLRLHNSMKRAPDCALREQHPVIRHDPHRHAHQNRQPEQPASPEPRLETRRTATRPPAARSPRGYRRACAVPPAPPPGLPFSPVIRGFLRRLHRNPAEAAVSPRLQARSATACRASASAMAAVLGQIVRHPQQPRVHVPAAQLLRAHLPPVAAFTSGGPARRSSPAASRSSSRPTSPASPRPPAVQDPITTAICGIPFASSAPARCNNRPKPRLRSDLILVRQVRPRQQTPLPVVHRAPDLGPVISCARRCFFTVIGYKAPPFTVASLASTMTSCPATRPIPAIIPAPGASPGTSRAPPAPPPPGTGSPHRMEPPRPGPWRQELPPPHVPCQPAPGPHPAARRRPIGRRLDLRQGRQMRRPVGAEAPRSRSRPRRRASLRPPHPPADPPAPAPAAPVSRIMHSADAGPAAGAPAPLAHTRRRRPRRDTRSRPAACPGAPPPAKAPPTPAPSAPPPPPSPAPSAPP